MEKKHVALAGLVFTGILAFLLFPFAQWGMFCLRGQEAVRKLGRFPDVPAIVNVKQDLADVARKYKLDPAKLTVDLAIEERAMAGTVIFTYLLVDCSYDNKRSWSYGGTGERGLRIETPLTGDTYIELEKAGVRIKK